MLIKDSGACDKGSFMERPEVGNLGQQKVDYFSFSKTKMLPIERGHLS